MKRWPLLVILAACGDVIEPVTEQPVEPTLDAPVVQDAPECDPSPTVITPLVSSGSGELPGTSLDALVDGAGLVGDAHDCAAAESWLANGGTSAEVVFDLQAEVELTQLRIWNHGDLGGARGARDIRVLTSIDNKSLSQLVTPSILARANVCPTTPQTFAIPNKRARFVRFEISTNHGGNLVGLAEVEFTGSRICP